MGRLASDHPTDLHLRKVLRDGRAGPGRCCYPRPPQRVHRRCKRERAQASLRLIRYRPCPGQPGGWAEWRMRRGLYGNVVVSSTTRASRADLRAASMISRTCRARSPARDRDCAGLETVEEMLDQGGTSYVDRAIARGGERCSLGCRARRVTDPATGAGHEGVPGVEPGSVQTFGRDLRAVIPRLEVTRPCADDDCRVRHFQGVKLRIARNGWGRGPVRTSTATPATSSPSAMVHSPAIVG